MSRCVGPENLLRHWLWQLRGTCILTRFRACRHRLFPVFDRVNEIKRFSQDSTRCQSPKTLPLIYVKPRWHSHVKCHVSAKYYKNPIFIHFMAWSYDFNTNCHLRLTLAVPTQLTRRDTFSYVDDKSSTSESTLSATIDHVTATCSLAYSRLLRYHYDHIRACLDLHATKR